VRAVRHWLAGDIAAPPPHPEHYFSPEASVIADHYVEAATTARERGGEVPPFPEREIRELLDNTWGDSGKAFFNNWLGWVYRLTHVDRHGLFMQGVDPADPLGMER